MSEPTTQPLATHVVRGVLWTGSPVALQLATTFLFYRIVSVESMGNFEWALVIVMLLALIADLGLGSALVQFRDAEERHYSAAFWTALITGGVITGLVWVSAPWTALILAPDDSETFARVLSTLVLLVPFAAVSGIFRARLQRKLNFRHISLAEGASSVLHFTVAVALR